MLAAIATLLLLLLLLHARLAGAGDDGNQCYVCVPRAGPAAAAEVARDFNLSAASLPLCEHFSVAAPPHTFRRRCPDTFKGCLTQYDMDRELVTRTCANTVADDCKEANRVRYCYCKERLCNDASPDARRPHGVAHNRRPQQQLSDDDEDSPFDHSGSGPPPADVTVEATTTRTTTTAAASTVETSLHRSCSSIPMTWTTTTTCVLILLVLATLLMQDH